MMIVAKGAPETFVLWSSTNDGTHIRQTGAGSHPRLWINAPLKRENLTCEGLRSVQLQRSWYRVSVGKLDPRRQADATGHRRQKKAAIHIDHRMVQDSVGPWPEMHMVPPLDGQRHAIAEGT
jgi:hypothetical protein